MFDHTFTYDCLYHVASPAIPDPIHDDTNLDEEEKWVVEDFCLLLFILGAYSITFSLLFSPSPFLSCFRRFWQEHSDFTPEARLEAHRRYTALRARKVSL